MTHLVLYLYHYKNGIGVICMNRGYAGFYKNYYLRSSYEYAYAKYLDFHKIPWSYEDHSYDIGYKTYKPDFFFYDQNGKLEKIVEIKSRNENVLIEARKALDCIKAIYNVDFELITYKHLLELYKPLPFSLTSTIDEWIKSEKTTINKTAHGKLNAHYNLKHSENAKKKIGEHTRKLWASESLAKKKMLEGLKKSGMKKGYIRVARVQRKCIECNKEYEVLSTSPKKYCSRTCSGNSAIRNATVQYMEKRESIHKGIRDYVIRWSIDNKDIVLGTPLNKIKTTISQLIHDIQSKFGVKDIRVISKAVFGEDRGRKELIRFMKKVCNEKIC
ncbi:restriction endonuclease [Metabacillus litoralis]|nr:restriction endonuclease [Metabacillus litoralis]